jgi:hypothetical protein
MSESQTKRRFWKLQKDRAAVAERRFTKRVLRRLGEGLLRSAKAHRCRRGAENRLTKAVRRYDAPLAF